MDSSSLDIRLVSSTRTYAHMICVQTYVYTSTQTCRKAHACACLVDFGIFVNTAMQDLLTDMHKGDRKVQDGVGPPVGHHQDKDRKSEDGSAAVAGSGS